MFTVYGLHVYGSITVNGKRLVQRQVLYVRQKVYGLHVSCLPLVFCHKNRKRVNRKQETKETDKTGLTLR